MIVRQRRVARPAARSDKRERRVRFLHRPTPVQRRWLTSGLTQPSGKLPLFDELGQSMSPQTIRSCVRHGWAEPWIHNPIKPDWLVCKLTDAGRRVLASENDT